MYYIPLINSLQNKTNVAMYVLITFVLTFIFLSSKSEIAQALSQASPGLIAIVFIIFSSYRKKELQVIGATQIGSFYWYILALFFPITSISLSYYAGYLFGYFAPSSIFPWYVLGYKVIIFSFMWPFVWALGEELGWRGYLQPKLIACYGVKIGLIITGTLWALWHYLYIFIAGYFEQGNISFNTFLLTITIILMSFTIGWIRIRSKSVWPCVLFHSASNAAWQIISYQYKPINSQANYFSGESGLFNVVFWLICFIIFWVTLGYNNKSKKIAKCE